MADINGKNYATTFFATLPYLLRKSSLDAAESLKKQPPGKLSVVALPLQRFGIAALQSFGHMIDYERYSSNDKDWLCDFDYDFGHATRGAFGVLGGLAAGGVIIAQPVMASAGIGTIAAVSAATIFATPMLIFAACATIALAATALYTSTIGLISAAAGLLEGTVKTVQAIMGKLPAQQAPVAAAAAPAAPARTAADVMIDNLKNNCTAEQQTAFKKQLREEFPHWFEQKQAPAAPKQTEFTTPSLNTDPTP